MPVYEFLCNACQKAFAKILTIAEHENERSSAPVAPAIRCNRNGRLLSHNLKEGRLGRLRRGLSKHEQLSAVSDLHSPGSRMVTYYRQILGHLN